MKRYLIITILFIFSFIIAFYFPDIRWFYLNKTIISNSKIINCSPNQKVCVTFEVDSCDNCFIPDYTAQFFIENKKTKQFVKINNFYMSEADHTLKSTQFIWTDNDQLDVYLEGINSKDTSNFFFKNLGDVKVIIHNTPYNQYN